MSDVKSLIYVPVLHTQKEAGEILLSLKGDGAAIPSELSSAEQEKSIQEMWEGIYEKIRNLNITYSSIRIYQDALPVCEREKEIVEKLSQKASFNHQLILELLKKGARLEGTEDPDLLIKEYDNLTQLISKSSVSIQGYKDSLGEYMDKTMKLMGQRDAFIAQRIKSTLKEDEVPLVFMGVRHELEKLLRQDFVINYIIYRLPFKKVKDIYGV
ncbi:hypothetical protein HY605_01915 [Candidatus Peregrinibacteria bacterium]|nr:hypothetical protein [Candidatus Peregrinibacteria bacterium]